MIYAILSRNPFVIIYAFFGVNFILQKSCLCKTNDKYQVCLTFVFVIFDEDLTSKLFSLGQVDSSELSLQSLLKSHTYVWTFKLINICGGWYNLYFNLYFKDWSNLGSGNTFPIVTGELIFGTRFGTCWGRSWRFLFQSALWAAIAIVMF